MHNATSVLTVKAKIVLFIAVDILLKMYQNKNHLNRHFKERKKHFQGTVNIVLTLNKKKHGPLEPQQFKSAPFQQATVSMISSVPELCRQYLDSHGWHLDISRRNHHVLYVGPIPGRLAIGAKWATPRWVGGQPRWARKPRARARVEPPRVQILVTVVKLVLGWIFDNSCILIFI